MSDYQYLLRRYSGSLEEVLFGEHHPPADRWDGRVDDPGGEPTLSHMETLLEVDVAERTRNVFALVNSISEPAHTWLTGISRVPAVIKNRPTQ